ncbi:MAG TPA: RagB/SusD family nutrient uptake outer membrane protein [Bacteroides xylanisolvens]|uniref:RagB/SusD family nutrient uptake outer membrane protein n=1 Tax=Bacteroides xylanisolvens TaxID=371601 RepID=A0A921I9B4_9BACE|nr:RagB/SusD family nutrient uptake outer membrane protein [Bacteroides xylanisolvens]
MIKKISYTFALIGSLLLSSCDSYLDIQPVGKVIPTTLADYRALLTTAYNQNFNDKGIAEVRTDIANVLQSDQITTPKNSFGDIEIWNDGNPSPSTRQFGWASYYTNIYYANAIIDKKDEITEGNQQDINQLAGEAYMMRAYMHFILVNLYGQPYTKAGAPDTKAVPLKLDLDLEGIPSKNTVKEIYTAILSDIASARRLMNKKEWETQYAYRFSTLSVDAMESRVYLYMGEWEKSYEASERVLAEKPNLEDLNAKEPTLPNNYKSAERITAYEIILNSDNTSSLVVSPLFYQKYEEGKDMRRAMYFSNKEGYDISAKNGKSEFKCTFRTGELYLNSAEAAAHLNKLAEARTRLLKLMENRYSAEAYKQKKDAVNAMNQTALITEILNERALELAFEGHRWFDLRRTTRPEIRKEIDGATYILGQDDARYTLRIPQDAIDANPGLLN